MSKTMYNKIRRGIALILAAVMLMSECSLAAYAVDNGEGTAESAIVEVVEQEHRPETETKLPESGEAAGDEHITEAEPTEGEDSESTEGEDSEPTEGEDSESTEGEDSEPTEGEDSEPTEGEDSESTEGEDSESTEGEDSESNEGEDSESNEGEDSEAAEGEDSESTDDEESEEAEGEDSDAGEEEEAMSELAETLLAAATLQEMHDLLNDNSAEITKLTKAELEAVQAAVEVLYAAIEAPTADEQDYYDLLTETFALLLEEIDSEAATLEEPVGIVATHVLDLAYGNINFTDTVVTHYDAEGKLLEIEHDPNNIYEIIQSTATTTNKVKVGESQVVCQHVYNSTADDVKHGNPYEGQTPVTKDFVIVLNDVNIVLAVEAGENIGQCAFSVHNAESSTVSIILKNNTKNVLKSGPCRAGLEKGNSEASTGALVVACEHGYEAWKNNTASGGHASGCESSCGILYAHGGGNSKAYHSGAGIGTSGCGLNYNLQNLMIAGGQIYAYGGHGNNSSSGGAAGIGTGSARTSSTLAGKIINLKITGGTINAYRGDCSAANIGGGYRGGDVTMTIYGGKIYAIEMVDYKGNLSSGKPKKNLRAAAVGGGGGGTTSGNPGKAEVTIVGGYIEAYSQYGAAIGAGAGGANGNAAASEVYIHGGTIIAETDKGSGEGAGAAIGAGGSLGTGYGGDATVVITGGNITAESQQGADIGGGGTMSADAADSGGVGTVTISGGAITSKNGGIGGGRANAGNGGAGTVTITGGTINGTSIGGGTSESGDGGNATVVIDGENAKVTLSGIIGGGITKSTEATSKGGDASVTVHKGELTCLAIGGGNANAGSGGNIVGITDGEGNALPGIYFTGGTIRTGEIGGGVNGAGEFGYATALVKGGDIRGQFVMKASDQGSCSFVMTGGKIHDVNPRDTAYQHAQKNGGALYMEDENGSALISGTAEIVDCTADNGGAVYMTGGAFEMTGGTITSCEATENGGAVYLGGGTVTINEGTVTENSAVNGGAVYVEGGDVHISGGTIGSNTAVNGGAVYVNGGKAEISGGTITQNTAQLNGGGIAVNNGEIIMSDGTVSENEALTGSGGGLFVSATDTTPISVIVYSGQLLGNKAATDGGAVGMMGLDNSTITVQIGLNRTHTYTGEGDARVLTPIPHDSYVHEYCPVLNNNIAANSGGAFFISGGDTTKLNIYCLEESGNKAANDVDINKVPLSDFLMVRGGHVILSTAHNEGGAETKQDTYGSASISGSIHVVGGKMDLYGSMTNPYLDAMRTIDLEKEEDHYEDHRTGQVRLTVSYHENFNFNGQVNSTQTAFDLQAGDTHEIKSGLYAHEGYELMGWNEDKNAILGVTTDGWHDAGDEYRFEPVPEGTEPYTDFENKVRYGDLTLYAIWKVSGYLVKFDPGVDYGEVVTGDTPGFACDYNVTYTAPENGFVRPGYIFQEWKVGEKVYKVGDTFSNLSLTDGAEVTFVAKWVVCNHEGTCIVTADDENDVITKECTLCGKNQTATLIAKDAIYDGKAHYAELECADGAFMNYSVAYSGQRLAPVTANSNLATGEIPEDQRCVAAGDYTVTLTVGDKSVSAKYTIAKATQSAPDVPTYSTPVENSSVLTIYPVRDPVNTNGAEVVYIVRQYTGSTHEDHVVEKPAEWNGQTSLSFTLEDGMNVYSVHAYYSETDNYLPSPWVSAPMPFLFQNGFTLYIKVDEGIDYVAGNSDTAKTLTLTLQEGYYLLDTTPSDVDETKFDFTIRALEEGDVSAAELAKYNDGSKLIILQTNHQKNPSSAISATSDVFHLSTMDIPKDRVKDFAAMLVIGTTLKTPTITAAAKDGEYFSGFTPVETVSIAKDSAFTVNYKVTGYDTRYYEVPKLTFGTALPAGTDIILRDRTNGKYYYYPDYTGTKTDFAVTDFIPMAGGEKFTAATGDLELQFVVDFSDVAMSEVDLTCSLNVATITSDGTNSIPAGIRNMNDSTITVHLLSVAHDLGAVSGSKLQRSVGISLGCDATASRYNHRDLALVLTKTAETLPMDARLKVEYNGGSATYRPTRNGNFVVPLGELRNTTENETINLQFVSDMIPYGSQTYSFTAELKLGTDADGSSANGIVLSNGNVSFTSNKVAVGVDITCNGNQRIFTEGSNASITVAVKTTPEGQSFPANYPVSVKLHREFTEKDTGAKVYGDTTLNPSVNGDSYTFNLSKMTAGNFCVVATIRDDSNLVVTEARYYFILRQ